LDPETVIRQVVLEQAAICGGSPRGTLDRDTELAATGLDSLGFATVVVELEGRLGVDPFSSQDEIVYPETFGELVALYREAGKAGD
jgi:acyl carrier protein